jgi:hypothetical protein
MCLIFISGHMDDSPWKADIYWLNNLLYFMKTKDELLYSIQPVKWPNLQPIAIII